MSSRLGEVIAEARSLYDLVIFDSPPLLMVTDSTIVGTQVDGVMLVVRLGQTKRQNVRTGRWRCSRDSALRSSAPS